MMAGAAEAVLGDILRDVGRRVAELRAASGLTQEAFAERADVTVQYLQRVEAGRENLTIRSLARLAELLEASIADLFAKPASRLTRPGRPPKRTSEVLSIADSAAGPPPYKRPPKRRRRR